MSNTITGGSTSYNSYSSRVSSSTNFKISDDLKEYIEKSGSDGKKILKAIKNLEKDGSSLSELVSTNTDDESLTYYNNGRANVKSLLSSINNVIKYCKNNGDDENLQELYKKLKNYTKKEEDSLKEFGIKRKNDGSLKIIDDSKFKYSIADGSFGNYILDQQKDKNTFFSKLSSISKKLAYDYSYYLSDETIQKINIYDSRNFIANTSNNTENNTSSTGSNFSALA